MLALAAGYLLIMLAVVRPALARLATLRTRSGGRAAWILVVGLAAAMSATATELIGIHAVFGAFLAGACVPRQAGVLEGLEKPLRTASGLLLPAFFVLIGLRTQVTLVAGAANWAIALAILLSASAGKLGASAVAARTVGFSWRDALAIGALLNTRGLVALVALDIGRNLGILSPALFTMFVIMTLVTTLATVPILRRLGLRPLAGP
jgi:Kef-type K+ transport system membrane component KefB